MNKPLAPPVSNAPPSNNQASSQTSGRKDFAQSNNAIPSTPAPTSTQSSQSGPPLSDIEKREQRFGGGNRGGMGRGPPPPSNVPPNRTNHDSNSSNGNNDRRDANKGIRR